MAVVVVALVLNKCMKNGETCYAFHIKFPSYSSLLYMSYCSFLFYSSENEAAAGTHTHTHVVVVANGEESNGKWLS